MSKTSESINSSFSLFGKNTNYNKNFPRNLRGRNISEEGILQGLHDWTCEWLKRSNISISEMARTLKDNFPLIKQYSVTLFNSHLMCDLLEPFRGLRKALVKLNEKDKFNNEPASKDVISLYSGSLTRIPHWTRPYATPLTQLEK